MSNTDTLKPPLHAPPALIALLAHLPPLALAALLLTSGLPVPGLALAGLVGLGATVLASYWRLPLWWRVINLLFVPALWSALQWELDSRWFLAGFALLALTSLGAVRTRVPLYLSSPRAARELAQRLPREGLLLDLGCGLGGPLAQVARLRPDARLEGIEAAPLNWLVSRLRLPGRAKIRLGSLWQADLSQADVVYAYLSPAPMARLWEQAHSQMKPGSLFISNTFPVPGHPPMAVVELDDLSRARLLIWRME
ncbi:MAG: hypothetical protein HZB71_05070 [Betaproteobacteria bacterium]|nr:hypothetical protein [Betaproteobacteria bacterium]